MALLKVVKTNVRLIVVLRYITFFGIFSYLKQEDLAFYMGEILFEIAISCLYSREELNCVSYRGTGS